MQFELRSPIRFASQAPTETVDTGEKAQVKRGDLFESWGLEKPKAEEELEAKDYRKMMTQDSQVRAAVMFKIYARLSSGWKISPASESAEDKQIAQFIRDQIDGMRGSFSSFLRRAMLAMAYGLSVHEMVLKYIEEGEWRGKIGLDALKPKRPDNFWIDIDDYGNVTNLAQKVGNEVRKYDPLYFIYWSWEHEGDYLGRSDLRSAYRWSKAKELIDSIWNIHLEKFATPTPLAKHSKGATQADKNAITEALSKLHATKSLSIPKDWEVDLFEAKRTGSPGYEEKVKYGDRMIARAILLPTLILDEGEKGAYALGKQHASTFTWVLNALGEELAEEIIEEQLIRPLVRFNFRTRDYPKFEWEPYDDVQLDLISKSLERLIRAEVVGPNEDWIRDTLGFPPRDKSAPPNAPSTPPPADPASPDTPQLTAPATRVFLRSKAAQKFQAAKIRERQNEIEQTAVDTMATATRAMLADLKLQVRRKKILETRDVAAVDSLRLKGLGDFRTALERALAESVMYGASDAQDELRAGSEATGTPMPELPESMGNNFSAGCQEAPPIEFATTRQQVVEAFQGKVPIQREALAEYGRESFTITGAFSDDALGGAKRIIRKGIRRGASYAELEFELSQHFEPYLETEGAVDPGVLRPYRLHNIVRTNMAEAYNTGRMNLFFSPSVGDFVVGFEYSAVLDDRTTEFCQEWDGTVMRKDDPRVGQVTPPNHYQCRGVMIPITRGEIVQFPAELPAITPAAGFAFSCCA